MSDETNRRILLIDDTPSIHEDFRKILGSDASGEESGISDARSAFFGDDEHVAGAAGDGYEMESAHQGQEGLEKVIAALEADRPFAMAFVDIRMPPGWDGVQTIKQLWKSDPNIQVVICTAYSDYSWDQTIQELGQSDQLLILKKPFDSVEIRQLASALTGKWNAAERERKLIEDLKTKEAEARAYSSSLETMNQALLTAKATSERSSEMKTEFLVHLSTEVGANLSNILESFERSGEFENLEPVIDSSRDLMSSLDNILDLTRLESGELAPQVGPSPVVEIARSAVEARRAEAESKGLTLTFELPDAVPESVECDGARVRQVLDQLIDNALRHSSEGAICVRLMNEPTSDWQRTRMVLEVRDHGPGVPEDMVGHLYEPFVGRAGAGLGLALAHELVKLMGGELTYERASGGGASFRATLEVGNLSGVRMVEG